MWVFPDDEGTEEHDQGTHQRIWLSSSHFAVIRRKFSAMASLLVS